MDSHSIHPYDVSQVQHLHQSKLTLGELGIELLLLQDEQHCLNVLEMFLPSPVVNQYIIKEHQHKLPQVTTEDVIHARLECS